MLVAKDRAGNRTALALSARFDGSVAAYDFGMAIFETRRLGLRWTPREVRRAVGGVANDDPQGERYPVKDGHGDRCSTPERLKLSWFELVQPIGAELVKAYRTATLAALMTQKRGISRGSIGAIQQIVRYVDL